MKKVLILFLALLPIIATAQKDSSRQEQKILVRVPFFNGGLSIPLLAVTSPPKQNGLNIHALGTGIWYFNNTRFSYQADITADFRFGRFQTYGQLDENGPLEGGAGTRNYSFATPAVSAAVNYELLDLDATKFYIYVRYQSHLRSWTSRETTAAGESEEVNNGVYYGLHYEDVYRSTLMSKRPLQQIHLGFTISDYRNRIEVRFFSVINPSQDYVYTATSALSSPGPTIEWTEKTNWMLDAGLSLNFNI